MCSSDLEIVAQLSQCPGGMDEILGKCIAFGVAFHHAGNAKHFGIVLIEHEL